MTARNTSRSARIVGRRLNRRTRNPIPAALLSGIQSQLGFKLSDEGLKRIAKVYKLNPGKGSFERCVQAVTAKGGAVDPKAICAASKMRTPAGKKELTRSRMKHKANWPWSKTTYSAATGTKRKVSADKKEEARLRKQESAEAARIRQQERREAQQERSRAAVEARKQKAHEAAEARKEKAEARRERKAAQMEARREAKRAKPKSRKTGGSQFGPYYEKLSPEHQAIARRYTGNKGKKRNPGRTNPEDVAAKRYESFHGRGPESITKVTRTVHEHSVLSGIGKLKELTIAAIDGKGEVRLSGFKGALLAMNEAGTQMYIEGGDQKVDLGAFGIRTPHETEVLGAALSVVYDTTKDHLGKDGGTASYRHKFGAKNSRLPMIVYDVRNKQLYFAGGGYTLPDEGIDG